MAVPWRLDDAEHDHARAHAAMTPHGGRYADILEAIGHTPLVEIPRMSPNPDVRILAKLEMLNPTGSVKDRVAKYLIEDLEARGLLHEGSIDPRADVGQHRHRARDDRPAQGLPRGPRDARQRHERAPADGGALRGGGHRLARSARLEWRDRAGQAPHLEGRAVRDALPVRQPGQPARPLRDDWPRDRRRLSRDRRLRRRPRHVRDPDGRVEVPARAEARRPDRGRRTTPRRTGPGTAIARRGVHPRDPRSLADRREVPRLEP